MSKFEIIPHHDDLRLETGLRALREYNNSKNCPINFDSFGIVMENDAGEVQAVAIAFYEWNWVFLKTLYVYDKGKGIGRAIMNRLEEYAREKGNTGIYLATSTFQTPAFYEALGYESTGGIPNFVNGFDRVFFAKRLSK